MRPAPTVGAAVLNEQPPRPLVLMVADESGAPRAAVSPTRHLLGSKLSGTYLNEFGLGCIHHAGGFHRRLPDGFLPKWVWEDRTWRLPSFQKGNNSFEGADLWLCLTEAAEWVCVARRIGFIASRFTQLQLRVQSRAAESQKERIASHLNLIASHLNWIANHLNAWCTRFHCRSRPRNNRSCQFRAACISCVGNRCQGIQFCLQKPSNYLAEAVHRFYRCLTVATVLDFSCLVMSIHVIFISLFWIWCLLFSLLTIFSVQRLHGFRQVVTHVQSQQKDEL